MAPRKEKSEKVTADQGTAIIVEYLKKQNRPYSATDISANLHNKVTKTYAAKVLKELHESQVIAGKAAGKQIVYHAIQDPADTMSLEDLAAMDAEITSLRETITTAKATEKLLRANLASVNATMSTEELHASVTVLEREKKDILGRLGPLKTGNVKPVLPEEKIKVDKEFSRWEKIAGKKKEDLFGVVGYVY